MPLDRTDTELILSAMASTDAKILKYFYTRCKIAPDPSTPTSPAVLAPPCRLLGTSPRPSYYSVGPWHTSRPPGPCSSPTAWVYSHSWAHAAPVNYFENHPLQNHTSWSEPFIRELICVRVCPKCMNLIKVSFQNLNSFPFPYLAAKLHFIQAGVRTISMHLSQSNRVIHSLNKHLLSQPLG